MPSLGARATFADLMSWLRAGHSPSDDESEGRKRWHAALQQVIVEDCLRLCVRAGLQEQRRAHDTECTCERWGVLEPTSQRARRALQSSEPLCFTPTAHG